MRTPERTAVLIGLITIFAMVAYPPWVMPGYGNGYGWLVSPPDNPTGGISHLDLSRLLLQVTLVCLAIGAIVFFRISARHCEGGQVFNSVFFHRRGWNRLFIGFWLAWVAYWVIYVHWVWANTPDAFQWQVVSSKPLPPEQPEVGPWKDFAESKGEGSSKSTPQPPPGFVPIETGPPNSRPADIFDPVETRFPTRFKLALMASINKSDPPGVEFLAGVFAPVLIYFGGIGIVRWIMKGFGSGSARGGVG